MLSKHIKMNILAVIVFMLVALQGTVSQFRPSRRQRNHQPSCEQSSCYPATGDLLIGRQDKLTASSTCGVNGYQRYCIVSHLKESKSCFVCDSNSMSHGIRNIVSNFSGYQNYGNWWQAENGKEKVSIQLDLEAEFHFTHLIMTFKTFRPAAMLVERSYDFGKTWKVYRYFAYDCEESFPGIRRGPIQSISDIICDDRYSDVEPSTQGEVIFKVLPPSIEIEDPYSEEVQDLLKMTNLRINFTELHTLGDNLLDSRDEIEEKYYFALYNMVVRGSCSCYGHASRCVPLHGSTDNPNMVHGECECTHNTKGLNCHECDDFYNELPWRPALGRETNACKRCECNNHATRCHFDPSLYEATGRRSGGHCDDCQHNTIGIHCEECAPFYYQDPNRDITDPDVCRRCECDPVGSEDGGECEKKSDGVNGLVAGRCICRRYVEGRRCDMCRNGYWNMRPDNPEGCERCTCNTLGTIGNYGCDKRSGECRCKRYVTGRLCDQCLPNYWGMSDDAMGCKSCDCDIGGAFDNNCDSITGQCSCKPNVIGRACAEPRPGYFVPYLDYLRYEGEFATGTGNTRIVFREPQVGREVSWTGPGFMRVSEGDSLEFVVDNIPVSMEYDIVIRYEPQMPERWEDVRVTVVRPGRVDQRGVCANSIPQDDFKATSLPQVWDSDILGSGEVDPEPPSDNDLHRVYVDANGDTLQVWKLRDILGFEGSRYYVVTPSSCLEKGVSQYTIRLDFNRYKSDRATPEASVLIDSIALVPNTESIQIFQSSEIGQRMKEEYTRYHCQEQQLPVVRPEPADVCAGFIFSISAYIQEGAIDCDCDPTGSVSAVCNPIGGQCQCKPNVMGRRCDQCVPGTYGFGPRGCQACNCNSIGSRDNFCDVTNGQCLCLPNVYGQQCNQCQRGFWGHPNCRPCQCNGRADECNNLTGECIGCRDNTGGTGCTMCAPGYYGDPRPGSLVGCRPCMCPGGIGSGYQHGDTCQLDTRDNTVRCDCRRGYSGLNCDRCELNYFGNPRVPGGSCEPCRCNNNIDPDVPGGCDSSTGQCLKCLFNTEGFSCQQCRSGYFGDATRQSCQACVCNILGTDQRAGECDRVTGQCPCLPHVIGQRCDRCEPNFWKIASGLGCEACHCDPFGSLSSQCNEFDGQCRCKAGRGGRDCSQCEDFYWGDPDVQCFPCNCNRDGAETLQCDRQTGQCQCMVGVAGLYCDRCDRGTTGSLPNCVPCGECFDNWDRIITELKNETNILVELGSQIKHGGAPGAFEKEFREMEEKLREVREIVEGANVTEGDLRELQEKLNQIRQNLTDSSNGLDDVNLELEDTATRVDTANSRIESIKRRVEELKKTAEELKANATSIRELDVLGAYNSTKESQMRSEEAQRKVDQSGFIVRESETIRIRVEDLISREKDEFDRKYRENEEGLRDVGTQVDRLDEKIVDLNEMVCDGRGDPCDDLCGGAGCGKCGGGLSCGDGAVTKALNALDLARQAEERLRDKSEQAENLLDDLESAQDLSNMAKSDAQMAYDRAMEAKNESESAVADLQDLLEKISDFLSTSGASPDEIRAVAEETLAMMIPYTPDQIRKLAREIDEKVKGLTDIDAILDATRDDLNKARDLKQRADDAKKAAEDVLDTAQRVIDALREARTAQEAAKAAIEQANLDIENAESDLVMIETEANVAQIKSNSSLILVNELKERLARLKQKFTENEINVQKAEQEAEEAEDLAMRAEQDANDLETKYTEASEQLEAKFEETRRAKERADSLRIRASKLYQDTFSKVQNLRGMESEFIRNEKTLLDLSEEIQRLKVRMELYLLDIQQVAKFHRTCST